MIDNLHKNTSKTLEQWIEIVKKENFAKHGEAIFYPSLICQTKKSRTI